MADNSHTYDVAVSFSGAQRAYVERIVRESEALGLRVFYDMNETVDLWGNNVIIELRRIYGGVASRFFVPFLSREYLAGSYPMDEFYTAMVAAVERGHDYILPILMDDVAVPRELLDPAIIYLRAKDFTPEELARVIADKVAGEHHSRLPRDVGDAMADALQVRLPRIPPVGFSAQDALDTALARVGQRFEQASGELEKFGFTCRVRTTETSVSVRVEERGTPMCELWLRHGNDVLSSGKLSMSFAWPQVRGDAFNGWVSAEWDADAQEARLTYNDFSGPTRALITTDELFNELWEKIVRHIEQRTR